MAIVPHKQIIGQQMATHSFNTKDAEKYGVESAVILYNMRHWLEKNKANNKHNHDGFYWTYNSAKAFEELFPYMNRRTISRNLQKLTFAGVVSVGNYNQKGYDRTQWYTIPMEFAVESKESSNDAIGQNVSAIGQNVSAIGQNVSPIPDINTNNKPDVKQERDAPKPEPVIVELVKVVKFDCKKFETPDFVNREWWDKWMDARKQKKAAMTELALRGCLDDLIGIFKADIDVTQAMKEGAENQWKRIGKWYIENNTQKPNNARIAKPDFANPPKYSLDDDFGDVNAIDSFVVPTMQFTQIGADYD